ncbi:hypothetical protein ACFQ0P_02270 [Microbacterium insulae]|uniref:Uncharacterized protein n=1 Tax=Microbacterium insulae TaxID=483014 RepID=A0ABW3AEB8_9MICO
MGRIDLPEVVAALANLAPAQRERLLGTDDHDARCDENGVLGPD